MFIIVKWSDNIHQISVSNFDLFELESDIYIHVRFVLRDRIRRGVVDDEDEICMNLYKGIIL